MRSRCRRSSALPCRSTMPASFSNRSTARTCHRRGAGRAPFPYRAGPGPAVVRLRVRTDNRVRPVWTVTGLIRGREQPDDVVIVGNHRDAWVYGGVDPSSGSAALVELAGVLGEMAREWMASTAVDSLRQLGRRRVRADLVNRVGRRASGVVAPERGRVPERRQRGLRLEALDAGRAGAEPVARRSGANRERSDLAPDARRGGARPPGGGGRARVRPERPRTSSTTASAADPTTPSF